MRAWSTIRCCRTCRGAYADGAWPAAAFPVAERLADRALSLPIYPQLDPAGGRGGRRGL